MKYVIDIPRALIDKARKVLAKGEYEDISDLAVTALENQIMLEEGGEIQGDLSPSIAMRQKTATKKAREDQTQQDYAKWISLNDFTSIKAFPPPEIKDLKLPYSSYEDLWTWGQVNRIFPIKLGTRILGNMQIDRGDYVQLNDFHKQASIIARSFGLKIENIDNELRRNRDERASTALPVGKNEDKTIQRYVSHFLASNRADGILDGAMARLKYCNIQKLDSSPSLIGLTEAGIEFMRLKNPILDESLSSGRTLSEDEINFYLKHIIDNVPEEINPLREISQIIKNGISSVTGIGDELKKTKPMWTDVMITTQRSGALGRMVELGLLCKFKEGIKVSYSISEKTEKFLMNLKSH